eukprot:CAMPEP_0178717528 /NCGR_PEP_ID=MMETSP0699-20121125/21978_1 /TAXON_ID=265572 /ORGANISM="Extubocellulus spinifer, Strain CCMP396" /LENGTH=81 /DNA_ID=CAMNT_0020367381 /DNA_START=12 /DNA_END=255 /DNA_ORIENTATION=-
MDDITSHGLPVLLLRALVGSALADDGDDDDDDDAGHGDSMSRAKAEERRMCCRLDDLPQDVNERDRRLPRIFHLECTAIGE